MLSLGESSSGLLNRRLQVRVLPGVFFNRVTLDGEWLQLAMCAATCGGPVAISVEKVYEYGDFSGLGIGT